MKFEFCSLASSSAGNSYFVRTDEAALLVDVGTAGKHIIEGLKTFQVEPKDLNAILVTHEHTDHIKSIRMMGRKALHATVYGSEGTLDQVADKLPEGRWQTVGSQERFQVGDITVRTFRLSHDAADPIGYSLEAGGRMLTIVTDTGIITDQIREHLHRSDAVVLEANHEVNILKMGPYPYSLKQRILGDYGHLSNETAGNELCQILGSGISRRKGECPTILLGHLSNHNNTPQQAQITVKNILGEQDYYPGVHLKLGVAPREALSGMIRI